MDEHHKVQRFFKTVESKSLVLVLYISDLGATELTNSVIPKQHLEPKQVNSIGPSHRLVAPILLRFHKESNSVTSICSFRSDQKCNYNGLSQIGETDFYSSVGSR